MRRQRRGWFDLPRDQRRAVATMVWMVPALHVAVRVFEYRRLRAWLDRRADVRRATLGSTPVDVAVWRLAIARVTRYSWLPGNCLSRSLALLYVLRARGLDVQLHLGVSLAGGTFAAHAWVAHGSKVLNDSQDVATRYVPLTSSPERQAFD